MRQAEVKAAKTMIERADERFELYPERLAGELGVWFSLSVSSSGKPSTRTTTFACGCHETMNGHDHYSSAHRHDPRRRWSSAGWGPHPADGPRSGAKIPTCRHWWKRPRPVSAP